jgi:hypothetical protein
MIKIRFKPFVHFSVSTRFNYKFHKCTFNKFNLKSYVYFYTIIVVVVVTITIIISIIIIIIIIIIVNNFNLFLLLHLIINIF